MNDRQGSLLFVYNADSGLFNTLADIGHKIFSPSTYQCALCSLTHGYFSERRQWQAFVEQLDCRCEFLHRDEFCRRYPDTQHSLPAVFRLQEDAPLCCLDAAAIAACADLEQLKSALLECCCNGLSEGP